MEGLSGGLKNYRFYCYWRQLITAFVKLVNTVLEFNPNYFGFYQSGFVFLVPKLYLTASLA
jgi:hypothetical protein